MKLGNDSICAAIAALLMKDSSRFVGPPPWLLLLDSRKETFRIDEDAICANAAEADAVRGHC